MNRRPGRRHRPPRSSRSSPARHRRIRYELIVLVGTLGVGSAREPRHRVHLPAAVRIRRLPAVLSLRRGRALGPAGHADPRCDAGRGARRVVRDDRHGGHHPTARRPARSPTRSSPMPTDDPPMRWSSPVRTSCHPRRTGLGERTGHDWTVIPFPSGGTPQRIDWVDYEKRNDAATDRRVRRPTRRSGSRPTHRVLVFTPGYNTFDDKCEGLDTALAATHRTRDPDARSSRTASRTSRTWACGCTDPGPDARPAGPSADRSSWPPSAGCGRASASPPGS